MKVVFMKYTETEYIKLWKNIKIKHAIELVAFELEYNIKTRTKTNLDIIKKSRIFKRKIDSCMSVIKLLSKDLLKLRNSV